MAEPEQKLVLNNPNEVVIRMYGQGFGDCFLLAFPRIREHHEPDCKDPVYVVVDSGVFFKTPGDRQRMRSVARSIREATGGVVDLLVATHEHHDHLCGFEYARDLWKQIGVRHIWLAWTEDENHPATQQYDQEKQALMLLAKKALKEVKKNTSKSQAMDSSFKYIKGLIDFAGGDDSPKVDDKAPAGLAAQGAEAEGGADVDIRPPRKVSKTPDMILDDFAKEPGKRFDPAGPKTERDFCEPGQVRTVPGTAVDAYVLGPPTDEALLGQEFDANEVYAEEDTVAATTKLNQHLRLAAASDRAEREALGAALDQHESTENGNLPDCGAPFPSRLSLPYTTARQHLFFRQQYFEGRSDRMIETEWLRGSNRLALQLDRVTNNTSLVLAFRLPDERVLLFVGDAQVGSWLSWHNIKPEDWHRPEGGQIEYRPTAKDLLGQTHVYKVGHHGSHNATLASRGLEYMPDNIIAFVPTSQAYPQVGQEWSIPFPTLLSALWRKSGGQLIFPHDHRPPYSYTGTAFNERVETAKGLFDPMVMKNKVIEAAVPFWRQVRI